MFDGLTSDFEIDEYGDRIGGFGIFEVVDGEFELIQ